MRASSAAAALAEAAFVRSPPAYTLVTSVRRAAGAPATVTPVEASVEELAVVPARDDVPGDPACGVAPVQAASARTATTAVPTEPAERAERLVRAVRPAVEAGAVGRRVEVTAPP
ncbi:hypothetical protein GCM10023258_29680 [Terrabacter aeriphilus]|uniref:Uncharacterized protein n=1 Tax=Terrabacter aeriphilus TaxID=515662 RepID=A0ABP9JIH4_9MICO